MSPYSSEYGAVFKAAREPGLNLGEPGRERVAVKSKIHVECI